jgi:hypothetical protein
LIDSNVKSLGALFKPPTIALSPRMTKALPTTPVSAVSLRNEMQILERDFKEIERTYGKTCSTSPSSAATASPARTPPRRN